MIELKEISFKYKNQKEILNNINLQIKEGEIISIIGKNGEGKSTLAKIIAGILKPSKGQVLIDEVDAYKNKNFKEIRKKLGIVFQNPESQILFNNVYDDVKFALNNLDLDNKDIRIKESLKMVGMEEYENSDTFKLSLGQKQRINIASVLAINPKYLILDEPTTMIDPDGKEMIYKIFKNLNRNKTTIIYITNNINEILLSDKIIIIENTKIKQIINTKELFNNIELLENLNIKIPDLMKLILLLNKNGFNINLENYNIEELANKITEVLKNEKCF